VCTSSESSRLPLFFFVSAIFLSNHQSLAWYRAEIVKAFWEKGSMVVGGRCSSIKELHEARSSVSFLLRSSSHCCVTTKSHFGPFGIRWLAMRRDEEMCN
jgi:hypothetical protein